jgi:ABC-type polysaccharide/polyol phosphate export permease
MSSSESTAAWTENRADAGPGVSVVTEVWRARELIGFFALRDLRVRYKQAVFGVLWALAQPVATVAVFTFVFGRLVGIDTGGVPYPLFALVGMVMWSYFASVVGSASDVLVGNSALITKVYFPRIAAPVASLLPPLVDMVVSLGLVAILFVVYGLAPGWSVLGFPLALGLLMAAALGTGLWLAALNVRYRDVRHAVTLILQVWLFISPVAYPSTLVSEEQRYLYALNPMTGVIEVARWSLVNGPWPGWSLAVSAASALLLLVSGLWYFRRSEPSFADVI